MELWRDRLRKFRLANNLTQEQLTTRSGVSQGLISQYENGKRQYTQESLQPLMKALRTNEAHLFSPEDGFNVELELAKSKLSIIRKIMSEHPPPGRKEKRRAFLEMKKVLSL